MVDRREDRVPAHPGEGPTEELTASERPAVGLAVPLPSLAAQGGASSSEDNDDMYDFAGIPKFPVFR